MTKDIRKTLDGIHQIRKTLVNELLELMKNQPKPDLKGYIDYKMFLWTLSTDQLLNSVEYERNKLQ
tara:strand:+ start:791 stop:988 length:198 start_codon:yes stop_codon:yes gene_type:complete